MKVSGSCYVIYGLATIPPWMVNSGFIVGEERTLVIDCGYNYLSAQTIYGYSSSVKPGNILIGLNTEPHSDHMGGNCFFREKGIDIYGHYLINRDENDLRLVKEEYNKCVTNPVRRASKEGDVVFYKTRFVNPNHGVTGDMSIDLGRRIVNILLTPGHTPMNISAYIGSEDLLFCGDILVPGYIPHLSEGTAADWKEWLKTLVRIEEISPKIIVPGHGKILKGRAIHQEITRMRIILKKAIKEGVAPAP